MDQIMPTIQDMFNASTTALGSGIFATFKPATYWEAGITLGVFCILIVILVFTGSLHKVMTMITNH